MKHPISATNRFPSALVRSSIVALLFCSSSTTGGCQTADDATEEQTAPFPTSGSFLGRITPRIAVDVITEDGALTGTLMVVIDGEPEVPTQIGIRPHVYTEASTGLDAEPLYRRELGDAYLTTALRFLELGDSFKNRSNLSYVFFDYATSCENGCSMRFYYSDQSFVDGSGRTALGERITDVSDRAAFWEESPDLWRSAELQFTWDEIAANTYQIRFDEETTEFENALGTLVVDVTGDRLNVTIEPVVHFMRDSSRPRYPIEPDAADDVTPEFGLDAGAR